MLSHKRFIAVPDRLITRVGRAVLLSCLEVAQSEESLKMSCHLVQDF